MDFSNLDEQLYMFKAKCTKVIDGDTIDITLDHGMRMYSEQRVRLIDVDTPERGANNYKEATEFTQSKVLNKDIIVQTYKSDVFGRYLARVWYKEGTEYKQLNTSLIEKGLIKPNSKWNKSIDKS
ncbi:nuclease family protein [Staphylococcus phage Twort]|uniref:ORF103 n=2 Tax=Staphylococcus phage Twort (strain DSM 17442 / HER 48) TaxID=2908167 RepID=Q4Z917_BPTWO|nr:endonuclease [Staphylococcus phage Twort]AAX92396.1 ORF103 [Staphylococcus phage Twort]QIW89049.1 nuclease family protein [Staphylococcus phage Twort]